MSEAPDRVRSIVAAVLRVPAESIGDATSPDSVSGWDSLQHMQLVLALEEEFGVQFAVEDMEAMHNVGAIVEIVGRYSA
jgi:acyl carrier protein